MMRAATPILRVSQWPTVDRAAWLKETAPGSDMFDLPGRASHLRPASRRLYEEAYGHWLGWLQQGERLTAADTPASRVSLELLVGYIEAHRDVLAPVTLAIRLTGIACLLRLIVPGFDPNPIYTLRDRLSQEPVRDKRRLVREPVVLYSVGERLMQDAEAHTAPDRLIDAVRYRDGLIIAWLALRPLRKRNIAALEIDRHLVRDRQGWRIQIPAAETKAHVPIDVPVPAILNEPLAHYLDVVRPLLLGGSTSDLLWISSRGGPLSSTTLAIMVAGRTEAALGVALSPHRFRDSAATMLAVHRPEEVQAAAAVLGHGSYRTTQAHYNLARSLDAARHYEQAFGAFSSPRRS